jgi:hypothetical protein
VAFLVLGGENALTIGWIAGVDGAKVPVITNRGPGYVTHVSGSVALLFPKAQVFIGAIVIDKTSNLLLGLSSQGHFAQGDADGIVMRPTGEFAPLTQQLVRLAGVDDSPSVILVPS